MRLWYPICIGLLVVYFIFLTYFVILQILHHHLADDPSLIILVALLFVVPTYIAIMIAQYKVDVGIYKRRDLTHVIFTILVGLIISLFFTIHNEWVPSAETVSTKSFSNMSISIQRPSPWLIPIRSVADELEENIFVTIRNYTSIDPVSISMSPPGNTIFEYKKFTPYNRSSEYDERSKGFTYNSTIKARHTGMIFNSTNEYVVNIDYRNSSKMLNSSLEGAPLPNYSSNRLETAPLDIVNITNITSSEPTNKTNTIDNDLNTRWSALGDRHWIMYFFDKSYDINKIGMAFYNGNVRNASFEINGQMFNSSGKELKSENFTLKTPLINTRSLQIVGHGNTANMWNSFTEVKIYGKSTAPTVISLPKKSDVTVYHASVPFEWTIRMTDLSLTTYFWIVMTGVVSSRFMSLILSKIEGYPRNPRSPKSKERNYQLIGWQDALGILFSFVIALILFSSFKQANTLTATILFNISIAFAFGFGFDKTLEVAPRFDPRFSLKPRDDDNDIVPPPQPPGDEPPQPPGDEPPQPPGDEPPQPPGDEPPQPPAR